MTKGFISAKDTQLFSIHRISLEATEFSRLKKEFHGVN